MYNIVGPLSGSLGPGNLYWLPHFPLTGTWHPKTTNSNKQNRDCKLSNFVSGSSVPGIKYQQKLKVLKG